MNAPMRQNTNGNGHAAASVGATLAGRTPLPRSEATQIEQSRAVAEVQAMVTIAHTRHRDIPRAIEAMQQSCARLALCERAFFSFRRGGSSVNGASIHLARELARCWGNIDYGLSELDRDDLRGRSEMLAFAWDLETNARAHAKFIVPHMRDKTGGAVPLTDMRDIYENNANHGARRLREQIFAVLPVWFREEAVALCRATLERGESDEPLPMRIAKMVATYAALGISRERLEARFGANVETMTVVELANFGILYRSIKNGETTKEDEFPTVAAGQVGQILTAPQQAPAAQPETPPAPAPAAPTTEPPKAAAPWKLPEDVVGQDKIIQALKDLIDKAGTEADVKAVQTENADRTSKMSMSKRDEIERYATNRIDDIKQSG